MSGHLRARPGGVETVEELRSHLGIFSFQEGRRRLNPTHKAAYRFSSVCDRAALWSGWWQERARERLPRPCKSCRNLLSVVESGPWWIPLGNATSLLCLAGESIRARYSFSARPLSRKHAGRSSNACVVRVCRPHGHGSTSGFPSGFIAAGKWRRKWAEVWACFFGRSGRDGNRSGPTYDCWSRRRLEDREKPDG